MSDQEALIVDLLLDGRGVAEQDGKRVFIPYTITGERVSFERRKKKKKFDEARLLDVIQAAPERISPKCSYFTVCGGCTSQHIDPHAQLKFKQQAVLDTMRRIGRIEIENIAPPIADKVWGYRRRARLAVKYVAKKSRVLVGFREKDAPYVADMLGCEVLHPMIADNIQPLSELVSSLSIKDKVPQIECSIADNAAAMVFRVLQTPSDIDLDLLEQFGADKNIRVYLQTKGLNTVAPLKAQVYSEPLLFSIPDSDINIEFSPVDFIQVHHEINLRMIAQALDWLRLNSDHQVLDLFCGLGNFTLPIARSAGRVLGIEGDASLVARARHNAEINNLDQTEFETVDLFKLDDLAATDLTWLQQHWDAVVIDPPRAGAREVIDKLVTVTPEKILYVSCHPATLARDADVLVNEYGYQCSRLGVMDMFPQTGHVETMALFERPS